MQSALSPAGADAHRIAGLFWWMTGAGLVIWVAVILLAIYCFRAQGRGDTRRRSHALIVGGGVAVPLLLLTTLLVFGLAMLPDIVARAPEGSLQIHVTGEQWWWRVRYEPPGGGIVTSANEIRLPVGEPVQFRLDSDNVIHSFWIPSLAGKMDMIPGRVTWLTVRPTETGAFRGACAEYCGVAHALMAFPVEVMETGDFRAWLTRQSGAAVSPVGAEGQAGERLFHANGCGACHAIRGTAADGSVGPDLTHVGSRLTLGAGTLPNATTSIARWIADTERVKPGVHMPPFGMLPVGDIAAIAVYLRSLE